MRLIAISAGRFGRVAQVSLQEVTYAAGLEGPARLKIFELEKDSAAAI